jgi:hypothetical protein
MTSDVRFLIYVAVVCILYLSGKYYHHIQIRHKKKANSVIIFAIIVMVIVAGFSSLNLSAWGHLNPSPYCGVGRFFCRVFKF